VSDQLDDGHEPRHKFHQHDADLDAGDQDGDFLDPSEHDAAWADALTPEEYVLSSPEAMDSALDQTRHL
jgi:hypothetical protein